MVELGVTNCCSPLYRYQMSLTPQLPLVSNFNSKFETAAVEF